MDASLAVCQCIPTEWTLLPLRWRPSPVTPLSVLLVEFENRNLESSQMTPTDNYPSIICKPDFVEDLQSERIENGYELDAPEYCGYTLIDDFLVHESFIYRVIHEIESCYFESGCIFEKEYLFSTDFLESLDAQEDDALMDVALLLLKRHLGPDHYAELYASRFDVKEI
jgi:hypothetical protein